MARNPESRKSALARIRSTARKASNLRLRGDIGGPDGASAWDRELDRLVSNAEKDGWGDDAFGAEMAGRESAKGNPMRRKSRRARRRNPGGLSLLLLGGGAAALAGLGFLLFKKPKTLVATSGQSFTETKAALELGMFRTAEGILAGDCILAKQGAAGFDVPGVPEGENTPLRVLTSGGAAAVSVVAESMDPRAPSGTRLTVPVGAISGAGDCAVGFN